ncbi:MAG: hypothetical protein ABIL44_12620 [candidate division WOR-3 bacterium]
MKKLLKILITVLLLGNLCLSFGPSLSYADDPQPTGGNVPPPPPPPPPVE